MSLIAKLQGLRHTSALKRIICGILIAALLSVGICPLMAISFPFKDVPSEHWARSAVNYCWVNCITNGISETEFGPDETLTRAQFITMMWRALYTDTLIYYEEDAQSTSSANWYEESVHDFSINGYLDGISIDDSSLNQGISRQEMALVIYNVCKSYNSELEFDIDNTSSSITDMSDIGNKYADAVKYCYYIGLLTGYEDGSFGPSKTLTRAEAATVLRKVRTWSNWTIVLYQV